MQTVRETAARGMTRRAFLGCGVGALVAAACDPFPKGSTGLGVSPRLGARPGEPTVDPTYGLSDLGLGATRDGILYVPTGYTADAAVPLFVALHGAGGSGHAWAGFADVAEARNMVLLAPDARTATWDLAARGAFGADVAFLDEALAYTFERCRIDPARLLLGGFSDGASYALSLGVSNGDLFSHLVAFSPGFYQTTEPPVGKPLIYVTHGTLDTIIPVEVSRNKLVPILRREGYAVTYQEFEGGHSVPAEVADGAVDWFLGAP